MDFQSIKDFYRLRTVEEGIPRFAELVSKMRSCSFDSAVEAANFIQMSRLTLGQHERGTRVNMDAVYVLAYLLAFSAQSREALRNNIQLLIFPGNFGIIQPSVEGNRKFPENFFDWTGNYGPAVRKLRKTRNDMSRAGFGRRTGISPYTIKNYELGYRGLTAGALVKLAVCTSDTMDQAIDTVWELLSIHQYPQFN